MDVRLFDHEGNPIGELSEVAQNLMSCDMTLEINGEHSLSITTPMHLDVGTRALTQDQDGTWHEWVVDEPEETHDSGKHAVCTYHLIWSLQYDLQTVNECYVRQPGLASTNGTTAKDALSAALMGTRRWIVGDVDVTTRSAAIMAFDSAWDRLNTVVKYWGGEVDAAISVNSTGVVSRKVCLRQHLGDKVATRRLEWHHNLTSVRRTPSTGPYYCRIIPLGNGDQEIADDGETTFEWPLDISEVNNGKLYLADKTAEQLFRVPSPATSSLASEIAHASAALKSVEVLESTVTSRISTLTSNINKQVDLLKRYVKTVDGATSGFGTIADNFKRYGTQINSYITDTDSAIRNDIWVKSKSYLDVDGMQQMNDGATSACTESVNAIKSSVKSTFDSMESAIRSASGQLSASALNNDVISFATWLNTQLGTLKAIVLSYVTSEETRLSGMLDSLDLAGSGGWEYPTKVVKYSTDDVEELLALAKEDLKYQVTPSVTYEATVSQLVEAGMGDATVGLGDEVQIVDYGFHKDIPLLTEERVLRIEVDMLGVEDKRVTIGKLNQSLERFLGGMANAVGNDLVAKQFTPYTKPNYSITVPARPNYTITTPNVGTVSVPTTISTIPTSSVPNVSGQVSSLTNRVAALERGTGITPVSVSSGSSSSSGTGVAYRGDGWIHQVNGVTKTTGTINFITTTSATDKTDKAKEAAKDKKAAAAAWGTGTKKFSSTGMATALKMAKGFSKLFGK